MRECRLIYLVDFTKQVQQHGSPDELLSYPLKRLPWIPNDDGDFSPFVAGSDITTQHQARGSDDADADAVRLTPDIPQFVFGILDSAALIKKCQLDGGADIPGSKIAAAGW